MNALIRRWRAPRTFRSVMVRVLVPRAVMFASLVAVLLVGRVMAVDPSAARLAPALDQPTWSATDRAAEPGCVPSADWHSSTPGSALIVHRFSDDTTVRVPFMKAWRANHNDTEVDDLWVLGVCP